MAFSQLAVQDLKRDHAPGPAKFDSYGALRIASGHPLRAFGQRAESGAATAQQEIVEVQRGIRSLQRTVQQLAKTHRVQMHLLRQSHLKQYRKLEAAQELQQLAIEAMVKEQHRMSTAIEAFAKEQRGMRTVLLGKQQRVFAAVLSVARKQRGVSEGVASVLGAIGAAIEKAVASAVMSPTSAFVGAIRSAARGRPRWQHASRLFPHDQRATDEECMTRSTTLVTVAKRLSPSLGFGGWKTLRAKFGKACKAERLVRHLLPSTDPRHVARPLLWTSTGPSVPGGGVRYVYLRAEEDLIEEVWRRDFQEGAASLPMDSEPWPACHMDIEPLGACEEAA